jgi:hypothetical protein
MTLVARAINAHLRSRVDYSQFILRQLPEPVDTPYLLIVQWDGHVIDTDAWTSAFRDRAARASATSIATGTMRDPAPAVGSPAEA